MGPHKPRTRRTCQGRAVSIAVRFSTPAGAFREAESNEPFPQTGRGFAESAEGRSALRPRFVGEPAGPNRLSVPVPRGGRPIRIEAARWSVMSSTEPPAGSPDESWASPGSSSPGFGREPGAGPAYVPVTPLLPDDPPKVGDFWLDARLGATPAGIAFTAHDERTRPQW